MVEADIFIDSVNSVVMSIKDQTGLSLKYAFVKSIMK